MRQHSWIANRFFGDNIDCSGNSRRTEQSRTASTHYFYTFYHAGGNLFNTIHSWKRTEDGTGIKQNLCIRTIQTVNTYLLEAAILTVGFYTHSRLETQSLCQGSRIGCFEHFHIDYIHQSRCQAAGSLVTVGGNDYTIQGNRVLFYFKILFQCTAFFQCHIASYGFIADWANFKHEVTFGKIL